MSVVVLGTDGNEQIIAESDDVPEHQREFRYVFPRLRSNVAAKVRSLWPTDSALLLYSLSAKPIYELISLITRTHVLVGVPILGNPIRQTGALTLAHSTSTSPQSLALSTIPQAG
jgi:hypothetical protein